MNSNQQLPLGWINATGQSGIFSFPFRIYSEEDLEPIEGSNTSFRYRVTFIKKNSSSARLVVPSDVWPNFQTHPSFTETIKVDSSMIDLVYGNTKFYYSQMRLDVWGMKANDEIYEFSTRLLDYIRLYTDQYWINTYEANFNLTFITSFFPIDDDGLCMDIPASSQKILGSPNFIPLSNDLLGAIFGKTLSEQKGIDTYWLVYFEGMNSMTRGFIDQGVLSLVLSVEIARNVHFQKLFPVKKESVAGVTFESPFNDTDLLKNLSVNLKKYKDRSLSEELPQEWDTLCKLYTARHQVAHGKRAAYFEERQMKSVTNENFFNWARDIRSTLVWLIELT